jgi:hypothetical protein
MINNYKCKDCDHYFVCKKISTLDKFDDESKKYIGVDITIDQCKDFQEVELKSGEDE